METKSALISAVLEVLAENNYEDWHVRVRTYLMAQDLWDIVEGTPETPQPNDSKVASKSFSKKNAMALHVIQISCGPKTFSEIREVSLASVAWNTLADKYKPKLPESSSTTKSASSDSEKKKHSASSDLGKKKHSASSEITDISSATIASDSSAKERNPELPDMMNLGKDTSGNSDHVNHKELYKHVRDGKLEETMNFLTRHPNAISDNITILRKTVLHMAVFHGREHIVEKLVEQMSEEHLKTNDRYGYTALAETTLVGNTNMAKCMLKKNKKLVSIKSGRKLLPVVLAVFHGHKELARFLYPRTDKEELKQDNGYNGVRLIIQAMYIREFGIALDLINREPSLIFAQNKDKCSPLYALASMSCAFPNKEKLGFWKRLIYNSIHIKLTLIPTTNTETRLNIQGETHKCSRSDETKFESDVIKCKDGSKSFTGDYVNDDFCDCVDETDEPMPEGLSKLVSRLRELLGIQRLHEMKSIHEHSRKLLRLMCERISPFNPESEKYMTSEAIFRAIEEGHSQFVSEVLEADPYLIWLTDKNGITLFQKAVLCREPEIFTLLWFGYKVKDSVMDLKDKRDNNVLHMAGMSTAFSRSKSIQGSVLQMQRELQWFKELEQIVHPKMREERNRDCWTPRELFTLEHKEMKEKGEQWMKNTANSCMVVGALIVTIMFAAAFTVPGGNNQNTGLPTFLNKKLFTLFIVSDAFSLFSSSTSVLMFLGILTSRYAEEDFLMSLPTKMIIGLSTLFFSIVAMMIAFSAALLLMLRGKSWIFLPVICFACVPVNIFVFMQFRLLVAMSKSTFGRGIFDRKMKHWL